MQYHKFIIPALQISQVILTFPTHSWELENRNREMQKTGQYLTNSDKADIRQVRDSAA